MPPPAIVDPTSIDTERVLYGIDQIRERNPQRFEMEQLTGIVHLDIEHHLIIGYKDIGENEFWVRGHMPGTPLMPGVVLCEVAAQLCSFYCQMAKLIVAGFMGFGGLEEVRFRGIVKPGDRLIMVAKGRKVHRRQSTFETQGFVKSNMVFHGMVIGVPIRLDPEEPGDDEGSRGEQAGT
jgi:3-hydroxyacyl-[acyl-carrier-protein] dehydratase